MRSISAFGLGLAVVAGFCGAVYAQGNAPFDPPPANSTSPASALDDMPSRTISNGIISAKVYLPEKFGFYRATRFDHAGMITHVTYKGHDYGRYWFAKTSPNVRNFTYDSDGVVAHNNNVAAGPVEEFGENGFEAAGPCPEGAQKTKCGRFLKIGVGILQRDNDTYNRFHTYPILNPGTRTTRATANSIRFTQAVSGDPSGYGYSHTKIVTMVPGKAQMTIEVRLKNTGSKAIDTTVYNHHFTTLSPGNEAIELVAPFNLTNVRPMPSDVIKFEGPRMSYLRAIKGQEQVASDLTGYGGSASDNDFRITNTKTGYGVRLRADLPIARLLWWSIPSTLSLEPYMAIQLKPGEEKRWTHTLDYYGPGDAT